MWIYRSRSSSRIPDTPSVLGLSEQVRFNQTSETVCTDGRVPDEIQERVSNWGRQLKRSNGRKCWASSEVLQAVDGWRNTGAAKCQHRRPDRSSPTAVQTLMNCYCQLEKHEPEKFVVQYLTQFVVKRLSAGDDTHSSVQHTL